MLTRIERNGEYRRVVWSDQHGKKRSKSLGKCGVVEARRRAMILGDLSPAPAHRTSILDLADRYRDSKSPSPSESYLVDLRLAAEALARFTANLHAYKLNRVTAAAFADHLGETLAPNTVRLRIRILRAIWAWALIREIVAENPWLAIPASHIPVDKQEAPYIDTPTAKLLVAAAQPDLARAIALARFAGLRRSELLQVTGEHWDAQRLNLLVPHTGLRSSKKHKRVVPISPDLFDAIDPALVPQPTERWVQISGAKINLQLSRLQQEMLVKTWPQPWHALRRSCEVDWLSCFPCFDVCKWMGHSPAVAFSHYHQTSPEVLAKVRSR